MPETEGCDNGIDVSQEGHSFGAGHSLMSEARVIEPERGGGDSDMLDGPVASMDGSDLSSAAAEGVGDSISSARPGAAQQPTGSQPASAA